MAATFNVQFTDAPDPTLVSPEPIRGLLTQALNDWTRHFDYTTGTYTVTVAFRILFSSPDVSLSIPSFTVVGGGQFPVPVEPSFGLAVAGRAADAVAPLELSVNTAYRFGALPLAGLLGPIERELGHALGIKAFSIGIVHGPLLRSQFTVYDNGVREVSFGPPAAAYVGPYAQAAFGGPVPLVEANPDTTTARGRVTVDSINEPASTLQPLDVALLRDAGLPALSDQEIGEHQIARLYVAAFGRNADSAGLIGNYGVLRNGGVLQQIAGRLVASAEFANRNGALSDADFVRLLYQNALGRVAGPADLQFYQGLLQRGFDRGTMLAAFSEGEEARSRLQANPNVTYAAAAEAQVARIYDTAFGRDADPRGFTGYVQAVITGATLQQVALSFIGSAEFANRYGAAPSDGALVDALYANTLHRGADAAGRDLYVRALGSGQLSRAGAFIAFSESTEHVNLIAQRAGARDAAGYNIDLAPHLGVIPMISGPIAG